MSAYVWLYMKSKTIRGGTEKRKFQFVLTIKLIQINLSHRGANEGFLPDLSHQRDCTD